MQWVAGDQITTAQLLVTPCEEPVDDRFAVFQPVVSFFLTAELLLADLLFELAAGEGEHHLILITVQWPEPALFQLAFTCLTRLDWCFIHGQYVAFQYMLELGLNDRAQQLDGPFRQVGQGAAAEADAGLFKALAVQRQVVEELVD